MCYIQKNYVSVNHSKTARYHVSRAPRSLMYKLGLESMMYNTNANHHPLSAVEAKYTFVGRTEVKLLYDLHEVHTYHDLFKRYRVSIKGPIRASKMTDNVVEQLDWPRTRAFSSLPETYRNE